MKSVNYSLMSANTVIGKRPVRTAKASEKSEASLFI